MHTHVTSHFAVEERNGWMDQALKREPRLDHAIRAVHEEHLELVHSLGTLIDEAEAVEELDEAFRDKLRRWIHRVRDHEARENEILEDAFVEDLGAGD
jgi:hypothetical protein